MHSTQPSVNAIFARRMLMPSVPNRHAPDGTKSVTVLPLLKTWNFTQTS
jgi:hypothetical protein